MIIINKINPLSQLMVPAICLAYSPEPAPDTRPIAKPEGPLYECQTCNKTHSNPHKLCEPVKVR